MGVRKYPGGLNFRGWERVAENHRGTKAKTTKNTPKNGPIFSTWAKNNPKKCCGV